MVPLSEIAQQRTVRLIPTCYYKPPVLRSLADDETEERILAAYEGRTSRRVLNPSFLGDFEGWGRTYIDASFHYTRKPEGNRFNGPERGAWYAGFDDRTAIEEVAFHHTRELGFTNKYVDDVQYNALNASFIGRFHDIRGHGPQEPCLDPETSIGYPLGQELAAQLRQLGSRGLIYPSVRYPAGICLVAFQPTVIQDVAPGAKWRLVWDGVPAWSATVV